LAPPIPSTTASSCASGAAARITTGSIRRCESHTQSSSARFPSTRVHDCSQ
jgi:hypothetical protein